jgi:hypothetical protein
MDKMEKLIATIMKEAEADGEPVTREEAEEMAKMEIKAGADLKRYEQSEKPRKKAEKVRKVDEEKKVLLQNIKDTLEDLGAEVLLIKTETEVTFAYNSNDYTIKLTKHRPPKK